MKVTHILTTVIISLILVLPISEVSYALSEAEQQKVVSLIQTLRAQSPQERSQAASHLSNYKVEEAFKALVDTINKELMSERPNTFVLNASFESLGKISTPSDSETLRKLVDKLRSSESKIGSPFSRVMGVADSIMSKIQNNSHTRETLPPVGPPVSSNEVTPEGLFQTQLKSSTDEAVGVLLEATSSFLSDTVRKEMANDDVFQIMGRDQIALEALHTLVRIKGKNPILVGPAGAGKTTIAMRIAQMLFEEQIFDNSLYESLVQGEVIETTPARISRLAKSNDPVAMAAALEKYFDAILEVERLTGKPIIVYIDEIHTLNPGQVEAMKAYLDSQEKAIKLLGSTTSQEYNQAFKDNGAIRRRFHLIGVEEFNVSQTIELLEQTWVPRVEKKYGVSFTPEAVEVLVENSLSLMPDNGRVDASVKSLQDTAIHSRYQASQNTELGNTELETIQIDDGAAYDFIQKRMGYPVNPYDAKAFQEYLEGIQNRVGEHVLGQERMIEDLANLWGEILHDPSKKLRVSVLVGPTGSGKSEVGKQIARAINDSPGSFLEIDGNSYKTGGMSLNSLLGAPNGIISSDKTSGVLMEWLDDPGRGGKGGVILINEGERAHEDFWEKIMEFMDTGKITGGDGRVRTANNVLMIITSNRGDKLIYPKSMEKWSASEIRSHINKLGSSEIKDLFTQATSGDDDFRLPTPVVNRVDIFTPANPITKDLALSIAHNLATAFQASTLKTYKIGLKISDELIEHLVQVSYQMEHGARPVVKTVERYLKSALSKGLAELSINRGEELSMELDQKGTQAEVLIRNSTGEKVSVEITDYIPLDPLDDLELMEKLENLESLLNERIIGQPDLVRSVSDAIYSHKTSSNIQRPLAIMPIGLTGTGKTELAKATAEVLYGDASRAGILPMGDIIYEGELNNIMGSPAGHVGVDEIRAFEQLLIDNPEGGVIVFDEFSNLGGKDPAQKEALIKKFYNIIDEGKWTSAATNRTYDLSKHILLFTGNDGEKIFRGLESEDLRMMAWEHSKDKSKIRKLLRESGVPEAFIGRMADIILMKPLLLSEMKQITSKLMRPTLLDFEQRRGVKIEVTEAFTESFAQAFFSQDMGGRSVRNIIDQRLKAVLAKAFAEARRLSGGLETNSFKLHLEDNLPTTPYAEPGWKRQVLLTVRSTNSEGEEVVLSSLNATDYASRVRLGNYNETLLTAYHEAGHAVGNVSEHTGQEVRHITIRGGDGYGGYVSWKDGPNPRGAADRNFVIARMAAIYSGQVAQKMAGFNIDSGWSSDLKSMRSLGADYLLNWALVEEFEGVLLDEKGKPKLSGQKHELFESKLKELMDTSMEYAENVLLTRWSLVEKVTHHLMAEGAISAEAFKALEEKTQMSQWERNSDGRLREQPSLSTSVPMSCKALF